MKKIILAGLVLTLGCEGGFLVNNGPPNSDPDPVDDPTMVERDPTTDPNIPDDESCRYITPGETPLARLTSSELNNTFQDLFPETTISIQSLPDDEQLGAFPANISAQVDLSMAEEYQRAAENVALEAADDLETLCAGDCTAWAQDFAYRAYRRPLTQTESDQIAQMFADNMETHGEQLAAQLLIEAILQSPSVLYRTEIGVEDVDKEIVPLTSYEVATRMSFFLTGSTPDQELLSKAEEGALLEREELESQARRLLERPETRERINSVFMKWFGLEHVDQIETPRFSDEQKQLMKMETSTFIDHVLWEDDATLSKLLTADFAFVSSQNGYLYDVEVAEGVEQVSLPDNRRGILSHPSFLAEHGQGAAIIHRGKFIKDIFLCAITPDPPDDLEQLPTFEEESERSKAEKRINATEEGCADCHKVVDNLGLAFDQYNENGVFVTEDEFGNPLSSEGYVWGAGPDLDGPVDGIPELADKLAQSDYVRSCVNKQFLTLALARSTSTVDKCSLLMMEGALERTDGSLTEMLVSVITTDAFRYRQKQEVSQ